MLCAGSAWAHPHIYDLSTNQEIAFEDLITDLASAQVVFIGELHDHEGHHRMQLEIIRALHERGRPIAIGLEMFQMDYQGALDRWVAGEIPENNFLLIYHQNWSLWPLYRPIFLYARDEGIPMVGLNIPREITRQVARHGFESLESEQLRDLDLTGFACIVDPAYEQFIRRALGMHNHGDNRSFTRFCEAQLLWDRAMANNTLAFLEEHPDHTVVVLAGSGHSWKYGIPTQLDNLAEIDYRVVLPEVPGRIDRLSASSDDTDYLWLDFGSDGWHVWNE
ncbi:ChaN family lipoprotein [Geoalkalibacter halelectricus]|nr:ChaN family lipoprotein [Geoalkalibacter halelectricus]